MVLLLYILGYILTVSVMLALESKKYGARNAEDAMPIYMFVCAIWFVIVPFWLVCRLIILLANAIRRLL